MNTKPAVGTNSTQHEIEQRYGAFGEEYGLLGLLYRMYDKRPHFRVEPVGPAAHDLDVYHKSVQGVPQLMSRSAGQVPKYRYPQGRLAPARVSHSDRRRPAPRRPSACLRGAEDDAAGWA